jgi:hypothetical protein
VSVTPAAGFEHGCPAMQTGIVGALVTVPKRPATSAAMRTVMAKG